MNLARVGSYMIPISSDLVGSFCKGYTEIEGDMNQTDLTRAVTRAANKFYRSRQKMFDRSFARIGKARQKSRA